MHMRIIILSLIALLINFAANGQGKPPIGGTATDTAWIRGSLQVDKKVRFSSYPNAIWGGDAQGVLTPTPATAFGLKTIDTPYRYSVSGNDTFMNKPYSTSVQGMTWINDSNAILVYRDDTLNGHVSNAAILYYRRLVNNVWQTSALLYNSEYDDRYGQFYKSITGDTLISQIRRVNTSPFQEVNVINAYSTNGGATISTYQTVTSIPYGYIPYGIVAAEGKYYQLMMRGDTMKLYRSDNGLTNWTLISTVTQGIGAVEPALEYLGNNTFIVLSRTVTAGINNLRQFVSTNLGSSFSYVGFAPFGNVQPGLHYDAKRKMLLALSTQRKNATVEGEFQGYVNVWVARPNQVITDTSKWVRIATLHRPIPNVKAFPGAGGFNVKNDSTYIIFITDAAQCDTGMIGDYCDKTSAYKASVTYGNYNFSNIGDISGNVSRDSMGNYYVNNTPQAFTVANDSTAIFRFDKPLVMYDNQFNQGGRGVVVIDANNLVKFTLFKDGRIVSGAEATFTDVTATGNIYGSGSISTGNPTHIASSPDILLGGTRDTLSTKQWGVQLGGTLGWVPFSTTGDFGFASGSGTSTYLPMWDTDGQTLVNSSFRSQVGFNQSLQSLVVSGFVNASSFGGQLYSMNNANGQLRGELAVLNSEFGSNTGSNPTLRLYDDNGNFLLSAFFVQRSTGNMYLLNRLNIATVPEYADNAAALSGGLSAGDVYRTGDVLKIVH